MAKPSWGNTREWHPIFKHPCAYGCPPVCQMVGWGIQDNPKCQCNVKNSVLCFYIQDLWLLKWNYVRCIPTNNWRFHLGIVSDQSGVQPVQMTSFLTDRLVTCSSMTIEGINYHIRHISHRILCVYKEQSFRPCNIRNYPEVLVIRSGPYVPRSTTVTVFFTWLVQRHKVTTHLTRFSNRHCSLNSLQNPFELRR